jgi:hypothetical protein
MAKEKSFKDRITPSAEKSKQAAVPTVVDAGAAFVGGMLGSAIGWPSLLVGLVSMHAGKYSETSALTAFGAGMFAAVPFDMMSSGGANLRQTEGSTLNGETGFKARLQTGKHRALAFKDAFAKKMFIDKILKKKSGEGELDGLGSGFAELDRLEQSVIASAMDFQQAAPNVPMLEPGYAGHEVIPEFDAVEGIDLGSI